jgi:hypothetical protein
MSPKNQNLYDYLNFVNQDVKISYKGPIDEKILAVIGNYIEIILNNNPQASRKLFKIFIELAQNIAYYSAEKATFSEGKHIGYGTLLIMEFEDSYSFITGNAVLNENIIPLIEKCEFINSLDRESLRQYKREQRRHPQGNMGNAHIGLIQVALTSTNPLDIEVTPLDDDKSYFSIAVKVNK